MARVLNPIVSESYMKGYIRDEGLIKPEGNIELTENAENVDIAQYATATINVEGSGGSQKRYVTIQDTTSVVFAENNGMVGGVIENSCSPFKFPKLNVTIDDEEMEFNYKMDDNIYLYAELVSCIPEQTVTFAEIQGSGGNTKAILNNVTIDVANPPSSLQVTTNDGVYWLSFEDYGSSLMWGGPIQIRYVIADTEWSVIGGNDYPSGSTLTISAEYSEREVIIETELARQEYLAIFGDITEGTHTIKIEGWDESLEYVDGIQRNYIFKDVKFVGETHDLSPAYAPVLNIIFDGVEYKNIGAVVDGNNYIWEIENVCRVNFNYVQNKGMMSVWLADPEDTSKHTISAYYEGQELMWINMTTLDSEQYPSIVNGVAQIIAVDNETKLFPIPVVEYTYKYNTLHYFNNKKANPIPSNGYVVGGQLLISDFNTGQISGAIVTANYIGGFTLQYFVGDV